MDFPPPDWPTSPTLWPALMRRLNLSNTCRPAGITERDVVEGDRRAALDQRFGFRMVAQFVRKQQRGNRFGQPGDMLGDIDQRHREIARGTQNGKSQRADQHDVAGGGRAALPEHDRPGQQRDRQHDRDRGVGDPQLFEITEAASARRQFPVDGGVKPVVLVAEAAKRPHQRHVVDDIDHFAVDGGGLVGEIVVQRLAGGGQMEHRNHHRAGDDDQARRHRQTDGSDQRESPQRSRCMAAARSRRTCSRP